MVLRILFVALGRKRLCTTDVGLLNAIYRQRFGKRKGFMYRPQKTEANVHTDTAMHAAPSYC